MSNWYERPIHRRAQRGGEIGIDGKFYRGGVMMPFYVPRPLMPQINEVDYGNFLAFCTAEGVRVNRRSINPTILHPHQHIDRLLLERIVSEGVEDKPVFVSLDLYILDGNHRWMLHLHKRTPLPAYQIDLPFEKAIELMFRFPKTYTLLCAREDN